MTPGQPEADLDVHLARLVDQLPEPSVAEDGPVRSVEREVFATLISHPAHAAEDVLRDRCSLDCLQWTLARRSLRCRGWVSTRPARGGGLLLATTATGRSRCAPGAAATWFERMLYEHGDYAELVGDLYAELGRTAQRWLDPGAVLDVLVVREGRGVAALAVHPSRPRPAWPLVLDEVLARGGSILLLWAWPEHRLELAHAIEDATRSLIVHSGRTMM